MNRKTYMYILTIGNTLCIFYNILILYGQSWVITESSRVPHEIRMFACFKKIFYNRETNSPEFCKIQWMSFTSPSHLVTQIIRPFLNSENSVNHKKVFFSQSWNPYTPYCSSSVEYLLFQLTLSISS